MIGSKSKGFARERFPDLTGDSFDCGICYLVSFQPKECTTCGTMYCGSCIDEWMQKKNECPVGCADAKNKIRPIEGALARLYRNLEIKCTLPNCGKLVRVSDLTTHEQVCQAVKCANFTECGNTITKPEYKDKGVCDHPCLLLLKLKQSNGNVSQMYKEIKTWMGSAGPVAVSGGPNVGGNSASIVKSGSMSGGATFFKWDPTKCGTGIQITVDGKGVLLKEGAYVFRTVIGDTAFNSGLHYWEIVADSRTENELKIGVATKRDFNADTAFCDYEYGFAYYGLGQLRHNSNSVGAPYGKRFKNAGVLGILLDMNKGTLSFALNGDYWGNAYQSDALKKGPIYPAVALLHMAGCSIECGKAAPSYFLQ
jgi:E3 ubiquitin-protein ligase NRDP1